MALDPFDLAAFHEDVRRRIEAGEPGLAQLTLNGHTLSLVCRGGSCEFTGMAVQRKHGYRASVADIKKALVDDLADPAHGRGALVSSTGVLTRKDFLRRAQELESRYLLVPRRDRELAAMIRTAAAGWED